MPTWTCSGCEAELWNPENDSEHEPWCPNIRRLKEIRFGLKPTVPGNGICQTGLAGDK